MSRVLKPITALRYRPMTLDDLDDVLEVERSSFPSPWTPDLFVNEFTNPRSVRRVAVRHPENRLVGFMIYWVILDEGHLMNIAIDPACRCRGAATFMLENMFAECSKRKIRSVTLEVRRGNSAALQLYDKFGFKLIGLRKNYYVEEGEDAVLMEYRLS